MQPAIKSARVKVQPTDEMLLEHSRRGSLEAFEEIFYRYCHPVYEYVYLLAGDTRLAEKIALKTFVRFFQTLPRYRFEGRVLPELMSIAFRWVSGAHKRGEIADSRLDGEACSAFERLGLQERALFLLGKKYGLSLGTLSRICRQRPDEILRRLDELEARMSPGMEWSQVQFPAFDYRATLRARMQRVLKEKDSKRVMVGVGAVLACVVLYGSSMWVWRDEAQGKAFFRGGRELGTGAQHVDVDRSVLEKEIWIQSVQKDRHSFFDRDRSFAEENLWMLPGRGKVLAVDYELFQKDARAGLAIAVRDLDLAKFSAMGFWIRGDRAIGYPRLLEVYFERDGQVVSGPHAIPVDAGGREVQIPIRAQRGSFVNRIAFVFADPSVGAVRSGRIYLDRVVLKQTIKPGDFPD